jgi:hypothetical protein
LSDVDALLYSIKAGEAGVFKTKARRDPAMASPQAQLTICALAGRECHDWLKWMN